MLIKRFALLPTKSSSGFTLLEVLITIVVLSIAATAIMGVFINLGKSSADPMIQQQATSIAEAYMEEILSKSFADPVLPETGGPEAGEVRSTYNDIQDYDGLTDAGARNQNNQLIAGLSAYTVVITVTGRALTGSASVPATDSMRIDISVSHPAISTLTVSGFRTNY